MIAFYLLCAGLVLASGLFYLLPGRRSGDTAGSGDEANLEWYRLRRRELEAEGSDELREDAQLRLLEDEAQGDGPAAAVQARFPRWVLLPVVAVSASALYYFLGAAPDVQITRQLRAIDDSTTPLQMEALVGAIAERSAQRPDNLHYHALLARYHMGQEDYGQALATYDRILDAVPQDAQALAYAAQAEYLAAGRVLSDSARLRAEQALAADPHQRTALGLLGMASYEQGQYRAATEYWERLLATEPPGSESAQLIAGVLANARAQLGEAPAQPGPVTAGVSVTVRFPEGAAVDPSHTVFVLARDAEADSRMPVAVQRLTAGQLPLTLRLDDSNSMAGQLLSALPAVLVVAQVSPDGRPGESNATWVGQAGPLAPSTDDATVDIELQPRTP